jgi:hypothetical protein
MCKSGECVSSSTPLWDFYGLVCFLELLWVSLGYAKTSSRPFHLLERDAWQSLECCSVEDDSVLPNVVSLEEKK